MFLLDTSVTSEAAKPAPEERVLDWLRLTPRARLFVSVVTLGEHRQGAELLPISRTRTSLEAWMAQLVIEFRGRILPVTVDVADTWGRLAAANRAAGRPVGMADTLIAATATVHELTVVTCTVRHFEGMGIRVLNPWEGT